MLAIAAAITFFGINRYLQHKRYAEIRIVQENINLLFQALNAFYYIDCRTDNTNPNPKLYVSINILKKSGLLPKLISTSLVPQTGQFIYNVSTQYLGNTTLSNKNIFQLMVSATLNINPTAINDYRAALNATGITTGTTLVWKALPIYNVSGMGNQYWISKPGLNYFKESTLKDNNADNQDTSCAY